MHTRRAHAVSPLAIVLPHPPIPRRTSSILSFNSAASPRTPRSCGSPCSSIFVPPAANRKSTDSWNSSNGPDDLEWEWKPEQVLLLSRTLDALPAHLVTPFNGPIPPSNLLDKIARGVSQAKGPAEWPHSLRATRVKLIELSRLRAKEQAAAEQKREVIPEELDYASEMDSNYTYLQDGLEKPITAGAKRPLYRQSSMDFMLNAVGTDINTNEHLARLSSRLQRAERQTTHHPYQRSTRANHCASPPSTIPSLINPSTPSSSTLNTLSSITSQRQAIRRTVSSVSSSSLSIISNSSDGILPNPRVRRLMEDDGFVPVPPPKDAAVPKKAGAKRAPSFGALAQEARREYLAQPPADNVHTWKHSGNCPSSDEEERVRNKQAKRSRKQSTPSRGGATPPPESPAPTTPISSPKTRRSKSKAGHLHPEPNTDNLKASRSRNETRSENKERTKENLQSLGKGNRVKTTKKPLPMNLQRNPSILGPELPQTYDMPPSPVLTVMSSTTHTRSPSPVVNASRALKSAFATSPVAQSSIGKSTLLSPAPDINVSPTFEKTKTLRRVRRLAPARRISFSSLVPPGEEADADGEGDGEEQGRRIELGSAFQLH